MLLSNTYCLSILSPQHIRNKKTGREKPQRNVLDSSIRVREKQRKTKQKHSKVRAVWGHLRSQKLQTSPEPLGTSLYNSTKQ